MHDSSDWWKKDLRGVPHIVAEPPGPRSLQMHERASEIMKGYSPQVRLFPVVFETGSEPPRSGHVSLGLGPGVI